MFDWDEANITHIAKHGVTPEEAEQAVNIAPIDVMRQDADGEERLMQLGVTVAARVLVIVTTWRGNLLRVVTAYPAPPQLREMYAVERREHYGD